MEEVEELLRQGFTLEEALKAVQSNAESQNGGGGGGEGRGVGGGGIGADGVGVGGGDVGGGVGGGGKREVSALEREMLAALASGMTADQVRMTH